jgi:hypothetical protein
MSGFLKVVSTVAGVASNFLPPPFNLVAAGVAVVTGIGAQLLQKKPPQLGNPSDITIGANNPIPYMIGDTYVGGTMVHDVGYGATTGGVPNPYRSMVFIWSGAGPIEAIDEILSDFAPVAFSGGNAVGYYHDKLYLDTQLGACPEGSALAGPFGAIPGWSAAHKLSGYAAGLFTLKDDKEGKTYTGGVPQLGMRGKGVLAYDPRQDDNYPGGAGSCRVMDETTYLGGAVAANPGCAGVTYALGRWQNGKKVMGVGFATPDEEAVDPAEVIAAIDWPTWVEFMNVCDANGWKAGGRLLEPGSRWDNLKRICQAGGGRPVWVGGKLTVIFPRPRVPVFTITRDTLAGDGELVGMKPSKGRINTLVPKVRLATHKWEHVQIEAVEVATYVAADGEVKSEEFLLELVQDEDQGAELAAYEICNRREAGPDVLACKPEMMGYRIGAAGIVDLPDEGMSEQLVVITGRRIDPGGPGRPPTVELTFETETTEKHAFCLGLTGTPPPEPTLSTGEELDEVAFRLKQREAAVLIATSAVIDSDPADGLLSATDTTITVETHVRRYSDVEVAVTGGTLAVVAAAGALNHVYYDDDARAGGAVTLAATTDPALAATSPDHPFRHYLGSVLTDTPGGAGTSGGGAIAPGWSAENYYNTP